MPKMSFAVVKFIISGQDQDDAEELVQEIPSSWLLKNNTHCKYPPEKFAKIYINKAVPPGKDWGEYEVEVEQFFETVKDARDYLNPIKTNDENIGRGQRKAKPKNYFSPDEEEQRYQSLKKEFAQKKTTLASSSLPTSSFLSYLNSSQAEENIRITLEENQATTDKQTGSNISNSSTPDDFMTSSTSASSAGSIFAAASPAVSTHQQYQQSINTTSTPPIMSSGFIIEETDLQCLIKKIDVLINLMASLDERLKTIEANQKEKNLNFTHVESSVELPVKFPIETLPELEALEQAMGEEKLKKRFVQFVVNVGGNSSKDFILRICRATFSNELARLCSWLGRRNNYAVGGLRLMGVIFDVVHHKFRVDSKDFEKTVAEWLRHANTRAERAAKH